MAKTGNELLDGTAKKQNPLLSAKGGKDLRVQSMTNASLFDELQGEATLDLADDCRASLRKAINAWVKKSPENTRHILAAKVNQLTGRHYTISNINDWLNSDPNDDIKAHTLPAVCAVVNSFEPIQSLLLPLGGDVATPGDLPYLEYGRKKAAHNRIQKELKILEEQIIGKVVAE